MLLKNQCIIKEIKEEIKKYQEKNKKESTMIQSLWDTEKNRSKREVHSNRILSQETRKISYKQPKLNLKQLEKEEQTKPKVSRRKEIINIREEINEIETKKTIAMINKTKTWFFEKINKIDKPVARLNSQAVCL